MLNTIFQDPNKSTCCQGKGFYFENYPASMDDDLGPYGPNKTKPNIFTFDRSVGVGDPKEKTSVYSNGDLDIVQKKSRTKKAGNYWQIG